MSTEATPPVVETPAPPPVTETLPEAPKNVSAKNPFRTIGRRKAAACRARTYPGAGKIVINGRDLDHYFPLLQDRKEVTHPLELIDVRAKYDVNVSVGGGGSTGQAGAIALAIARALIRLEPVHERKLRDDGLLSRDARVKERKKYGRRGARRGFQFSKR